jgi:hypothetical protein
MFRQVPFSAPNPSFVQTGELSGQARSLGNDDFCVEYCSFFDSTQRCTVGNVHSHYRCNCFTRLFTLSNCSSAAIEHCTTQLGAKEDSHEENSNPTKSDQYSLERKLIPSLLIPRSLHRHTDTQRSVSKCNRLNVEAAVSSAWRTFTSSSEEEGKSPSALWPYDRSLV